jgi:hypothetical protein
MFVARWFLFGSWTGSLAHEASAGGAGLFRQRDTALCRWTCPPPLPRRMGERLPDRGSDGPGCLLPRGHLCGQPWRWSLRSPSAPLPPERHFPRRRPGPNDQRRRPSSGGLPRDRSLLVLLGWRGRCWAHRLPGPVVASGAPGINDVRLALESADSGSNQGWGATPPRPRESTWFPQTGRVVPRPTKTFF